MSCGVLMIQYVVTVYVMWCSDEMYVVTVYVMWCSDDTVCSYCVCHVMF